MPVTKQVPNDNKNLLVRDYVRDDVDVGFLMKTIFLKDIWLQCMEHNCLKEIQKLLLGGLSNAAFEEAYEYASDELDVGKLAEGKSEVRLVRRVIINNCV